MAVAFVDCPPEQIPSLRSFFSEMYWPEYILSQDESFLTWQFGPTPSSQSDHYHVILGLVDGAITGCIGYIPVQLSVAGQVRSSAWAANWMVAESTRRLGMGPLLMRELSKRFDITLALGGKRDAHDLLPRMGWTDFGSLPRYVRVLDVRSAAALTESGTLRWPVSPPLSDVDDGSVVRVEEFGDDVTSLWDRGWGTKLAGTRRSAEFLNWRYAAHPNFIHRLFELRRGAGLEGIAVTRVEQVRDMPVLVARILELLGEPEQVSALVAAVLRDARAEGVAAVDFFCGSRRLGAPLHAAGFLAGEQPPGSEIPILFQPVDRERTGILFMANLQKVPEAAKVREWYVTKADGDQDRPS